MTQEIEFKFEFQTPATVNIEETNSGSAIIEGTLLAEGVSRNGNLYTLPEMENIANQAEGIPLYYGTTVGIDTRNGIKVNSLHDNSDEQKIGKILKATLDKLSRKVHFIAEVFNTANHPDIIQQIKNGWGVSIGGKCKGAEYVRTEAGRILLKVKNMIFQHLQVIPPTTIRGMDAAKIDSVRIQETAIEITGEGVRPVTIEIQECMIFEGLPEPTLPSMLSDDITYVIQGSGIRDIRVS